MRYPRAMRLVTLVFALGLLGVPALVSAQTTAPAPSAVDVGMIEGRVTNVDYQRGLLRVETPHFGHVDVSVMPTTSVQTSDPGYHAITDVSRGSKVQILASRIGGKLVAQIIRLFKH